MERPQQELNNADVLQYMEQQLYQIMEEPDITQDERIQRIQELERYIIQNARPNGRTMNAEEERAFHELFRLLTERLFAEPQIQEGVAFEIHNKYHTFIARQNEYLEVINREEPSYSNIYDFIEEKFTANIKKIFKKKESEENLAKFNMVLNKIKTSNTITDAQKSIIAKSVDFAFAQPKQFIENYINIFLDETCKAYTTGENQTSCPRGIVERFVISIGVTVRILCSDKCKNKTYEKLDKIMNPRFNVVASAQEWFEIENKKMEKAERKKNFIHYLKSEAIRLDGYKSETDIPDDVISAIHKYSEDMDYAFADLQIGGGNRKSRKMKKTVKSGKASKSRKNI